MNALHIRMPPNERGRDFVIGDLHGHLPALREALARRGFEPSRDRLFSVGDLIDRGPDSPGCAALLAEPWFLAARGNHEDMLLRVLAGERALVEVWRANGGDWGLDGRQANAEARAAGELCARMPIAITVTHRDGRTFGICHAQCPVADWSGIGRAARDPALQREMLWGRSRIREDDAAPVAGVDWTIHGHTVVHRPLRSANALFIETGIFLGGPLTLLCLDEV